MPTSTRLDKETETLLKEAARCLDLPKSEIIRASIREYCGRVLEEKRRTPWQIYQQVHVPGGSGHGKRVRSRREIIGRALENKRKKWSS